MSHDKNDPLSKPMMHENHKKPVTRRDFLAQGFLGTSAFVAMPGLLTMLERRAYGAECSADAGGARMTPFLCFDMSGGANIPGSNVIVGRQGGQDDFIADYVTLGLPGGMSPKNAGQTNNELGLLFHSDSAILRGIQSVTAATTRANVEGAVFCAASNDDTDNNPHNPLGWIHKAGANGELTGLIGTRSTDSGGNSKAPAASLDPAARPVLITRPADALALINPGKLATLLSTADVEKVLNATKKMSATRLARFQEKDMPAQIKELVDCGYINSVNLLTKNSPARVDPSQDAIVNAVFPNLADANQGPVASASKLILDGFVGAATVEQGGFDYHDSTRATGEQRDFSVGVKIGRALEMAARKQQDLMIYVFTDGGVVSSGTLDNSTNGRGKGQWNGDSGLRSATFTLLYKKDGRPGLRTGNRQIGYFKDNGTVETTANVISNSVENMVKAVVANYMALHGNEGKLADVVGNNPFGADLEKYLVFNKLR